MFLYLSQNPGTVFLAMSFIIYVAHLRARTHVWQACACHKGPRFEVWKFVSQSFNNYWTAIFDDLGIVM